MTGAATSPRRWRRRSASTRPRCRPGSTRPARTSARTARNGNRRFDRGAFEDTVVNDIASATGVDAAKVRSALQDLRPDRGARRDRRDRARRHPPEARDRPRRDDRPARRPRSRRSRRDQRDAFATELAQKLNIDVAEGARTPCRTSAAAFGFGFGRRHGSRRGGAQPPLSRWSSSSTTRRPSGRPSSAPCASRASPWRRPPAAAPRSRRSRARPPAVIVLDVMMPDLDGVAVVRRLRADGVDVPVCILSARDEVEDRVAGLQAGRRRLPRQAVRARRADRAAATRCCAAAAATAPRPLVVGDLVVDPRRHVATRGGRDARARRAASSSCSRSSPAIPGQVLSREQLLTQVWGYAADVETNVVDVFVGYLRRKLEAGGRAAHAPHRARRRLGARGREPLPGSLRARITIAAVARGGARRRWWPGAALLAAVERDGRAAVDADLRARASRGIAPGGPAARRRLRRPGLRARRPAAPSGLLVGSGTFAQVAVDGQVVQPARRRARRPARRARPATASRTVRIAGRDWRSLTVGARRRRGRRRGCRCCSTPRARRGRAAGTSAGLVLLIGLAALALTGARRVGASPTLAVRPLARLRAGAARVSGAEDLATPLPDDEGPGRGPLARPRAQRDARPPAGLDRRRRSARCRPPAASPPTPATSCARRSPACARTSTRSPATPT